MQLPVIWYLGKPTIECRCGAVQPAFGLACGQEQL